MGRFAHYATALLVIHSQMTAVVAEGRFCIFRSTDRGRTWVQSARGLPESTRTNAIGSSGDTFFAGTDSGLYASQDHAQSWQPVKLTDKTTCRVLCLASFDGKVLVGTESDGIFLSMDSGQTFSRCKSFASRKVRCLLFHAGNLYAGTDVDGVFLSNDSGESWQSLQDGLPEQSQVFSLASVDNQLFAGLYGKGLYTWSNQVPYWNKRGPVFPLALASIDGTLVAGHNPGSLFLSRDLGSSWLKAKPISPSVAGELADEAPVWALAANGNQIIAGASDGIFISENHGETWTRCRVGLPGKCPGIAFHLTREHVLAAVICDSVSKEVGK